MNENPNAHCCAHCSTQQTTKSLLTLFIFILKNVIFRPRYTICNETDHVLFVKQAGTERDTARAVIVTPESEDSAEHKVGEEYAVPGEPFYWTDNDLPPHVIVSADDTNWSGAIVVDAIRSFSFRLHQDKILRAQVKKNINNICYTYCCEWILSN